MRLKYQWLGSETMEKNSTLDRSPPSRQVLSQPSVLIVDDDRLIRAMLQLGLTPYGFNILLACDGWEAFDMFKLHQEDIAVVLLDVCMPGLDGLRTMNGLRAIDPQVQVCFMSGDTGDYDPESLRRSGAVGFLAKPFLMDKLAETLHQLVHSATAKAVQSPELMTGLRDVARQITTPPATCDCSS